MIRSCPFCNDKNGYVVEENEGYRVLCPHCGVCGPLKADRHNAVLAWNKRCYRMPADTGDYSFRVGVDDDEMTVEEAAALMAGSYAANEVYTRYNEKPQQERQVRCGFDAGFKAGVDFVRIKKYAQTLRRSNPDDE